MLVASPLVWSHYFALVLVPIAIYRPRLGWLWALPVLMWACPPSTGVRGWQEGLAWGVVACCFVACLGRASGRAVARGPRPARLAPVPKLNASS
jgi:hypothetical protein